MACLDKGVKDLALVFRCDACSGVLDFELQKNIGALFGRLGIKAYRHGTHLGELDCVADEIDQYLAQLDGVGADEPRDGGRTL
jgi:hypothetical protein